MITQKSAFSTPVGRKTVTSNFSIFLFLIRIVCTTSVQFLKTYEENGPIATSFSYCAHPKTVGKKIEVQAVTVK